MDIHKRGLPEIEAIPRIKEGLVEPTEELLPGIKQPSPFLTPSLSFYQVRGAPHPHNIIGSSRVGVRVVLL